MSITIFENGQNFRFQSEIIVQLLLKASNAGALYIVKSDENNNTYRMSYLFQDWDANKQNIKGRIVMVMFRLAHLASTNKLTKILWLPYLAFYKILVEWFMCIELPHWTNVGKGLTLAHGQALVVNGCTIIGDNCYIRQSTTLGNIRREDGSFSGSPILGNNVELGSNVCIIGDIRIGNNVRVGAGSVVVKDIPDNSIAVGNPARVIRALEPQHQKSDYKPEVLHEAAV